MKRLLSLLIVITAVSNLTAEDWPRWRGPRADGTWNGPPLPLDWPQKPVKTIWKRPIGGGYAGVTTSAGLVYTMDLERPEEPQGDASKPTKQASDGHERVLCFDAVTGEPVWSHRYPVKYGNLGGYANGPRTSVTIHDGLAYALGAVGHLFCFDARTGAIRWQKDTVRECGAVVPMWGFAASPVVDGDRLIVHLGAKPRGSVIAFDRRTGSELWRSLNDPAGYCTPLLAETPSGKQWIIWTPENVHGLDPETGKRLWTVPYKVTYGVSIASPIVHDGQVFVTGYWEGSKAIRLGPKPMDHMLTWEDGKNLRGLMAQPLLIDDHVYTMDKGNGLTCFEWKTGKKLWDDENTLTPAGRNPHASIVRLAGTNRILALNAVGELVHAQLSPMGYDELGRVKVLAGKVWSHPAFSGRLLFAHTDGAEAWRNGGPHELVCVELAPSR